MYSAWRWCLRCDVIRKEVDLERNRHEEEVGETGMFCVLCMFRWLRSRLRIVSKRAKL